MLSNIYRNANEISMQKVKAWYGIASAGISVFNYVFVLESRDLRAYNHD